MSLTNHTPASPPQPGADHRLGEVLLRAAHELSGIAKLCADMQRVISPLLECAQKPEFAKDFHTIQEIDRAYQTLVDLENLLAVAAEITLETQVERAVLSSAVRLDSLAERLFDASPDNAGSNDENEISWL